MEGYRENTNSIYFISDLHLGHGNIIHYCARPFASSNVKEMNSVLVSNWNNVVHELNLVYFLGNLSKSDRKNSTEFWLSKLNGNIHYIKGNHEKGVKKQKNLRFCPIKNINSFLFMIPTIFQYLGMIGSFTVINTTMI